MSSYSRWCRGYSNFLYPKERTTRDSILEGIRKSLGEDKTARLRREGEEMTFMQVLGAAKELLGIP